MNLEQILETSPELKSGYEKFENWRNNRIGKRRISAELWELAEVLGRKYGACKTAFVLRLNAGMLLKRIKACNLPIKKEVKLPTFTEIKLPSSLMPEYNLEFEKNNTKVTLHTKNTSLLELGQFLNSIWSSP